MDGDENIIEIPCQVDPAMRPRYATPLSAGADLFARNAATIEPGRWCLIPTGLRCALPAGYEGQIRPRSGLAINEGITLLNAPGTIDADYRGEIAVALINLGAKSYRLCRGDRIAQMVISPVLRARFNTTKNLPDSARAEGGFGSTGR